MVPKYWFYAALVSLCLWGLAYAAYAITLHRPEGLPHRLKYELYSIQGETSYLGCPGQHPEWIEIDDHQFFEGCFGDSNE